MEVKNLKELRPRERAIYEMELLNCSFDADSIEEWVALPIPGNYQISSFGRVMRITEKRGQKILAPVFHKCGFWITLRDENNKSYGRRIDRMMGVFLGLSYEKIRKVVHHDEN